MGRPVNDEGTVRPRRVVVALDASSFSLAALEAAAEMAAQIGVALHGVFVEDINLLRLGQLAIVREVGAQTALSRPLDLEVVERSLRAHARQVARALAEVAARTQVVSSFEVTRGAVLEELLKAAEGAGLVAVGRAGRQTSRPRTGSIARALVVGARQSVWLQALPGEGPVVAICRDVSSCTAAVEAASRLPWAARWGVDVVVDARDPAEAQRLAQRASVLLARFGARGRNRVLAAATPRDVVRLLKEIVPGVVVIGAEDSMLPTVLDEMACSILVVR